MVVAEGGGWAAFLPGLPIAGEGANLDDAITDMIDALREYAADWNERLLDAPNHRDNWSLVTLTEPSTDEQMKQWILHDEMSVTG